MNSINKKVLVSVTNDIITDARVGKVCGFLSKKYDLELIGLKSSLNNELVRSYKVKLINCFFKKGFFFYAEFNIKLLENAPNEEKTIFRSKAVGEPPLLLAISHFLALKNAVSMANETSNADLLNAPATPSKILAAVYNDQFM